MVEPDKSAGCPGRRSFACPMSSSLPNPYIVSQSLVPARPPIQQAPSALPDSHTHAPWSAGTRLKRIDKPNHKENCASIIVAEKQQLHLHHIHHIHHLKQQQQLEWIQMTENSGMSRQFWDEQVASVSPTPSLEYHSSNYNSGSSPLNMMMDHSTPAGYACDINSPASMQADSPASNDDVSFSSMFLGPQITAPTGYDTNELQGYANIKGEREDEIPCFINAARNPPKPGHSFEHHLSPSTSPPESFAHWNHTPQASELSVGFLAPPQNPMAAAQGLHGFSSTPVLTGGYTRRGMPNVVPNFNPSMEQGSTLGAAMNANRSGSLGNFAVSAPQERYQASIATAANGSFSTAVDSPESTESFYPGSFSDNYELSSSGQHFVLQTGYPNSAVLPGCQPQLQEHHQARPTIVYPVSHNNMDSLESHAAVTNTSFGTHAPTWSHPSPSMATSTESLPRVTIPSPDQQHNNFSLRAHSGSSHGPSQTSQGGWGRESSRLKETTGSAQFSESKPRKPLPTSRSLASKKDKRGRQSSRSRSPAARRPASQASTQGRRPRKQAKRQANRELPAPARSPELPVVKSMANPADKTRALALEQMPAYLAQSGNSITTPQHQLPPLVSLPTMSSSPVPAWSTWNIDNPRIGDHVYKYHYPKGAKPTIVGAGRITPSTSKYDDAKLIERRKKDEYILYCKEEMKWTYSQIRQAGGFTEAESTLRGRYRMITKEPEERVRKPKWSALDLKLLERAVRLEASVPGTGAGTGAGSGSRKRGSGGSAQSTRTSDKCAQAQPKTNTKTNGSFSEKLFSSPASKSSMSGSTHTITVTGDYGCYPHFQAEYHSTNSSAPSDLTAIPATDMHYIPRPPTLAEFITKHGIKKPIPLADLSRPNVKIPWKRVSVAIKEMGGSYQFGSATCKKRWQALVDEHVVKKGKDINEIFYEWLWGGEVFAYHEEEEEAQADGEEEAQEDGEEEDGEGEEDDGEGDYDYDDEEEVAEDNDDDEE